MHQYQRDFIDFAISHSVLRFGTFTLKSGRISPYFFNAGLFNSGSALSSIGRFYASTITDVGAQLPSWDLLFGPAYKGIPLAVTTAVALNDQHALDVPVTFNRKEKKDHGEGGNLVGASLRDQKVLVLDDVITAGTAIRESVEVIRNAGGVLAGVVVAFDRQERGPAEGSASAMREVEKEFGVPVRAIVSLGNVLEYLKEKGGFDAEIAGIEKYREQYGVGL